MDLMAVGGLLFLVCVILWVASLFTSDPARAKKLLLWAIALQMTSCGLCFKASGDKSASDKSWVSRRIADLQNARSGTNHPDISD